jgi:transcription initiation factor IIE alpha subunit
MKNEQRILDFLAKHNQGYDDDQLSELLNIQPRQQVNQICRRLENQGKIQRYRASKIRNCITR